MNGWLVVLLIYVIGWVVTFAFVLWDLRGASDSRNEPGEDEAAIMLLVFLWPLTWVLIVADFRRIRRKNRVQKEQRQNS